MNNAKNSPVSDIEGELNQAELNPVPEDNLVIVGIGASAGGLEAIQEFFKAVSINSGLAYVVIQHLSPDYKSLMDELLARITKIRIFKIEDGMLVEPDTIYLIPPRKNLTIYHGKLYLESQNHKSGLNLPIDIFLRSLAAEKEKHAIGIILSGTGSDGTLGTKAIKEAGGMIMAQDPQTSKFDGMPRSSIATGLVDYILTPAQMPEEILNFIKHPLIDRPKALEKILPKDIDALTKIMLILRNHCGIDFSYYKENTIIRRLERRLSINRFETLEQYVAFLTESSKEKDILYRELLIGVTRFFRDGEAFDVIQNVVLPELFSNKNKQTLRVWSVACSTGEEAYTLAIIISEYVEKFNISREIKIFATDIDKYSLEYAGTGFYPDSVVSDIDPKLLNKYFIKRENGYQASDSLRKMVIFATHNVLKDPPFSKIDLISCRNLFIYFKPEIQTRVLSMFYFGLNPESYLFMGSSETTGEMTQGFQPVDSKWKIYKYNKDFKPPILHDLPLPKLSHSEYEVNSVVNRARFNDFSKLDRITNNIFNLFVPPSVIIDKEYNILQVINDITKYIKVQPGRFSQNLFNLVSDDMKILLNSMLRRLKPENNFIVFDNISTISGLEDDSLILEGRLIVDEKSKSDYYLISFISRKIEKKQRHKTLKIDVKGQFNERINELERELQFTKESLQATVEELETSNEELQSSNEELIASNEELQSTNEELQSVNEELYTVNSEFQNKIDELTRLNADINNLLKNTNIGTLYLDRKLLIRKFTPSITKITNIRDSDVGRPAYHIVVSEVYTEFLDDVRQVMETLQPLERELRDKTDQWLLLRLMPYRTDDNAIDGVIVTFIDISKQKKIEEALRESQKRLNDLTNIIPTYIYEIDRSGIIKFVNRTYEGLTKEQVVGTRITSWFPISLQTKINNIIEQVFEKEIAQSTEYTIPNTKNELRSYISHISPLTSNNETTSVVLTANDITDRKKIEKLVKENEQSMQILFKNLPSGFALHEMIFDKSGNPINYRFLNVNPEFENLTSLKAKDIIGKTVLDVLPDTEHYWLKTYGQVVKTGESIMFVQYTKALNKYFEVTAYRPVAGQFATFFQDVTARILFEKRIQRSEDLLKATQRLTKTGGWEWNIMDKTMYWTDEVYRLHGIDPKEIEPGSSEHIKRSLLCYTPEHREIIKKAFNDCCTLGTPYDFELPFTDFNGKHMIIRTVANPVYYDNIIIKVLGTVIQVDK